MKTWAACVLPNFNIFHSKVTYSNCSYQKWNIFCNPIGVVEFGSEVTGKDQKTKMLLNDQDKVTGMLWLINAMKIILLALWCLQQYKVDIIAWLIKVQISMHKGKLLKVY